MRLIDADAIPYVDLNGDMPQSKIRVYVAFKEKIDKLPTIELGCKWIPCSEKLPKDKQEVLVTEYGDTDIGRRFDGRWLDRYGDKMKDVTAWMPRPKPYREGE